MRCLHRHKDKTAIEENRPARSASGRLPFLLLGAVFSAVMVPRASALFPPDGPSMFERQFSVMGTTLTFTGYPAEARFQKAVDAAFKEMERLNAVFSFHDENSLLSRVNRAGSAGVKVTDEFILMLDRSRAVWKLTGGAFDPTVGPLMRLWKLDKLTGNVPGEDEITRTLEKVGFDRVKVDGRRVMLTKSGMSLDFGACVKGYAVDRAAAILRARGFRNFMVNLGGNIYASGLRPDGTPGNRPQG